MTSQQMFYGLMIAGSIGMATANVNAGLVAQWNLDEGAGTAINDSSGNGFHGTMGNLAAGDVFTSGASQMTWTTGRNGNPNSAIRFNDLAGDMVRANTTGAMDALGTDGDFSIALWFKREDTNDFRGLVTFDKLGQVWGHFDYGFWNGANGYQAKWQGTSSGTFYNSPHQMDVETDQWHHVAMVFDAASSITVYLDAEAVHTDPTTLATIKATANWDGSFAGDFLSVGGNANALWPFLGSVDEFALFDHALSLSEVRQISGIPEPASLALLALGGLAMMHRRSV